MSRPMTTALTRPLFDENPIALQMLGICSALAAACYRHARLIVAVTCGIRNALLERGLEAAKIAWVPNGVNPERYRPLPRRPERRRSLGSG